MSGVPLSDWSDSELVAPAVGLPEVLTELSVIRRGREDWAERWRKGLFRPQRPDEEYRRARWQIECLKVAESVLFEKISGR